MEVSLPCLLSENENIDVFASFSNALKKQLDELDVKKGTKDTPFEKDSHWHKIDLCFQAVSKECTKLAVAFSKPPIPSKTESNALLQCVLQAVDVLRAWFVAFPVSEGKCLTLKLRRTVHDIFDCVGDLVSSIKEDGCSESPHRLHLTGKIWKLCESFQNLPKDNKSAVLMQLSESYQLLSDALGEVEREINDANEENSEDDDDDEEQWTLEDKKCFPSCLGLIKTAKGTLKRLRSNIKSKGKITSTCINELDRTVDATEIFSSCVDDLILSMYPPVDHAVLLDQPFLEAADSQPFAPIWAKSLGNEIDSCVKTARVCHFMDDSDISSLEFLQKAVEHNLAKLHAAIQLTSSN